MQTYRDYRPDRRFQPTLALSPDGTEVAYSDNSSGQYNLTIAPVAGGPERRLTDFTDATVRDIRWSKDGSRLIFCQNPARSRVAHKFATPPRVDWKM